MITQIFLPLCGNAVALALSGTLPQKLVRTGTNADHEFLAHSHHIQDLTARNGNTYHYQAYTLNGTSWQVSGEAVSIAVKSDYLPAGPDVRSLLRERLEVGIQDYRDRKLISINGPPVPVRLAPPVYGQDPMPLVSIHATNESPRERGIGDNLDPSAEDTGWLTTHQFDVVVWCQNPDERHFLGRAVRAILFANLTLLDNEGVQLAEFSSQDMDMLPPQFPAPIYTSQISFSCMSAQSVYRDPTQAVRVVTVQIAITPTPPAFMGLAPFEPDEDC
jgi:hypothetical protein